jgi:hypothetical protein
LLPRTTPRVVLVIGLTLGAAGLAAFGALEPGSGIWSLIVPAQFIGGLGIGAALTTVTKATLDGVPGQDAGVASALTNAMRQIGGAAGVATLNAVAIAATRGDSPQALTDGYVVAFIAGAALLAAAAVVALVATSPRREAVAA